LHVDKTATFLLWEVHIVRRVMDLGLLSPEELVIVSFQANGTRH
jgi:hypothetical protein